ncbi:hypothetical protein NDI47_20285 [Microcoleus vaginatus GB1-A2]|nr:hypothetical protein [Microcoleus sp. FACHB-61]
MFVGVEGRRKKEEGRRKKEEKESRLGGKKSFLGWRASRSQAYPEGRKS